MSIHTLHNRFHGTSVKIRSSSKDASEAWFEIQTAVYGTTSPAARARLRRTVRHTGMPLWHSVGMT